MNAWIYYILVYNDIPSNNSVPKLSICVFKPTGRPRGGWDFDELRRYHTIPSNSIGAPKMYILDKTLFWNINCDARFFSGKFKELPGATFLRFAFFTAVPKNGQKNGQKISLLPQKTAQNGQTTEAREKVKRKKRCPGRCQQPLC